MIVEALLSREGAVTGAMAKVNLWKVPESRRLAFHCAIQHLFECPAEYGYQRKAGCLLKDGEEVNLLFYFTNRGS